MTVIIIAQKSWSVSSAHLTRLQKMVSDNIVTKREMAKYEQFLFRYNVFNFIYSLHFHLKRFSAVLPICFQSCLLQFCYLWESVNIVSKGFLHSLDSRNERGRKYWVANIEVIISLLYNKSGTNDFENISSNYGKSLQIKVIKV